MPEPTNIQLPNDSEKIPQLSRIVRVKRKTVIYLNWSGIQSAIWKRHTSFFVFDFWDFKLVPIDSALNSATENVTNTFHLSARDSHNRNQTWKSGFNFSKRRTLRSETIFDNWKPFKNDEKCFLFHLKSSFRSQDI